MPQEDGVSVQQSLVSAALCRLQGEHRMWTYNMATMNTRRSRKLLCNHFNVIPTSGIERRPHGLRSGREDPWFYGAGGGKHLPGGVGFASSNLYKVMQSAVATEDFFCTVSASESDTGSSSRRRMRRMQLCSTVKSPIYCNTIGEQLQD